MAWMHRPQMLRRVRTISLIAAGSALLLTVLSRNREAGINAGKVFIAVDNGCLHAGVRDARSIDSWRADREPTVYAARAWNAEWALAWRPFHAVETDWRTSTAHSHAAVVPLWPMLLAGVWMGAFAHGRLTMLRDSRSSSCRSCGYELAHVRREGTTVRCPECGVHAGPQAGRMCHAGPEANVSSRE
jgi:hypothetical protein